MALIHINIEKVVVESDPEIKKLLLEIRALLKPSGDQQKVDTLTDTLDKSTDELNKAVADNTVS